MSQPITLISLLPLVAPCVVILTFIIDRLIAYNVRKKESKRSWYLKAYFDNSIKKVDEFFETSERMMSTHLEEYEVLNKKSNSKKNNQIKIEYLATVNSKFTDLKRKFEINVLSVFHKQYPEIKDKIEVSLLDFEDTCTKIFNDDIEYNDKFFIFIEEIYTIKSNLIIVLSQPVFQNNESGFTNKIYKRLMKKHRFPLLIFFKI